MTGRNFRGAADALLSLEFGCPPGAAEQEESTLTVSALHTGQRAYFDEPPFFRMACTGRGALITADERLHPFLRKWMAGRMGHWLFELPNLMPLMRELAEYGYALGDAWHVYLPGGAEKADMPAFPVRQCTAEAMSAFACDDRFLNAFSRDVRRPDQLALCAADGAEIMGIAACAEDAPGWMQIGVDVLPPYRSRGVGTYLVHCLTKRLLAGGTIPFYGTSGYNFHSQNIALHCGFRPAWVEIAAVRTSERTQVETL